MDDSLGNLRHAKRSGFDPPCLRDTHRTRDLLAKSRYAPQGSPPLPIIVPATSLVRITLPPSDGHASRWGNPARPFFLILPCLPWMSHGCVLEEKHDRRPDCVGHSELSCNSH